MQNALKTLEKEQLKNSIEKGLDDINKGKTHNIDELWNEIDDLT